MKPWSDPDIFETDITDNAILLIRNFLSTDNIIIFGKIRLNANQTNALKTL